MRRLVATVALLLVGCTPAQRAAIEMAAEQAATEGAEWRPAPGDTRTPGTRRLYPYVQPGEWCSSIVAAGVLAPCEQVLNPCADDADRTTMFVPEVHYCHRDPDEFGEVMATVAEACATEWAAWYGCDRRG